MLIPLPIPLGNPPDADQARDGIHVRVALGGRTLDVGLPEGARAWLCVQYAAGVHGAAGYCLTVEGVGDGDEVWAWGWDATGVYLKVAHVYPWEEDDEDVEDDDTPDGDDEDVEDDDTPDGDDEDVEDEEPEDEE